MKSNVPVAEAINEDAVLPERVQEALGQLVGAAKEGLLALSVEVVAVPHKDETQGRHLAHAADPSFANLAHLGVVGGPAAVRIVSEFRVGVNSGAAPTSML